MSKMYSCIKQCLCATCKNIKINCAECKHSVNKTEQCLKIGIKTCKYYMEVQDEQ